jgi:DNA end-binding protein Ku
LHHHAFVARALWTGAITFGLVNVPVKLYQATPTDSGRGLSFHRLHGKCGTRIQHRRWCPVDEVEVPWEEVVLGYEFARGRYAVIRKEELPGPERDEIAAIAIEDFVHAEEVDPMLFDRAYWVVPDGPARPYAILHQALLEASRVAIARVLIRTRVHLAALRPAGDHLVLETMFFQDEVVAEEDVPPGVAGAKVAQRELDLARELVDKMTRPFDPTSYRDVTTERMRKLIEQKIAEKDVTQPRVEVGEAEVIDIMEALRRSIARGAEQRAEAALGEGRAAAGEGKRGETRAAPGRKRAEERTWHGKRRKAGAKK